MLEHFSFRVFFISTVVQQIIFVVFTMTPLTWICYVWWWVVYVVKKTIRWATRNAEHDPGDLVGGHDVEQHYRDGVYQQGTTTA